MDHPNDCREADNEPLTELEAMLTEDERDPGDFNPPSRLKDRELNRTLAILDEIENNKEGGKK